MRLSEITGTVLISAVLLTALYHRLAVRAGVREALEDRASERADLG